jgi:hypothetical protein
MMGRVTIPAERRPAVNRFVEHHRDSIRFEYSCFDRILLNAIIQPLQQPAIIVGFLERYRQVPAITKAYLRQISEDYHQWVQRLAAARGLSIVEPPKGVRREQWVEPYYQALGDQDGIAVILKSRENARVAVSYATSGGGNRIEVCPRFVWQYYFYRRDRDFGRMFVRICPYFPFNARVCLNGHEWLARQVQRAGVDVRQQANAFLECSDPDRLQHLADALAPAQIVAGAERWLAELVPFFTDFERRAGGCGHRLFVSQVEYCTNLVFEQRVALDRLAERLLDLNRGIGRPDKLSVIFGRRITKSYAGGLKTQIADYHLGNPVIRSEYKQGSIKQYVRDDVLLRTETTSYHTPDLGVAKSVERLPHLRQVLGAINERYLQVQQDVLETYVDRGQLARLRDATLSPSGRRTPGLKLDDPRLLAVMQALTRFVHLARGGRFRTRELHQPVAEALGQTTQSYTLARLRYDLGKLRAKGLVQKVAGTQTYRLTPEGFRVCVLFLKLVHRIYAPLTAAALEPVAHDARLPAERQAALDRLYVAIDQALDLLLEQLGLRLAA